MSKKRKRQAPRRNARPPRPAVVDQVHEVDPLDRLRFAAAAVHRAQGEYLNAINGCRAAGVSWSQIGQAVGVSRQAIQQRHEVLERAFHAPAGSSSPKASA